MTTAVCDLFFAPLGIASAGGHGSAVGRFVTSGLPPGGFTEDPVDWLELPVDFFGGGSTGGGGFAEPYVNVPGVKSSGL